MSIVFFCFLYSYVDFYSILSVFLEEIKKFFFLFSGIHGSVVVLFFIVNEVFCGQ